MIHHSGICPHCKGTLSLFRDRQSFGDTFDVCFTCGFANNGLVSESLIQYSRTSTKIWSTLVAQILNQFLLEKSFEEQRKRLGEAFGFDPKIGPTPAPTKKDSQFMASLGIDTKRYLPFQESELGPPLNHFREEPVCQCDGYTLFQFGCKCSWKAWHQGKLKSLNSNKDL